LVVVAASMMSSLSQHGPHRSDTTARNATLTSRCHAHASCGQQACKQFRRAAGRERDLPLPRTAANGVASIGNGGA
jgi:hypothetical protein